MFLFCDIKTFWYLGDVGFSLSGFYVSVYQKKKAFGGGKKALQQGEEPQEKQRCTFSVAFVLLSLLGHKHMIPRAEKKNPKTFQLTRRSCSEKQKTQRKDHYLVHQQRTYYDLDHLQRTDHDVDHRQRKCHHLDHLQRTNHDLNNLQRTDHDLDNL